MVNEWRGQYNSTIDRKCPVCTTGECETVLHRFWECGMAQQAWHWATHILNRLVRPNLHGPWQPVNCMQTIFSARLPHRYKRVSYIWASLRGVVLWTLWISRNDAVFNGIMWTDEKLYQKIWFGVVDYGRVAWQKVLRQSKQQPQLAT